MPRGYKLVHSILRALGSPATKTLLEEGAKYIAPRVGELLIKGTERLEQHGLGKVAEKIADASLRGLAALPNTVSTLSGVAGVGADFMDDYDMAEPYNHEPNATFPDPNVAYKAMATLSGERGYGEGSGMLVFGSDQPFKPESERLRPSRVALMPPIPAESRRPRRNGGRTPQEMEMGIAPHPINLMVTPDMSAKNTFGYIGWPGAASQLPNPRYTEAGQYFRRTGPRTNTGGAIPAYGIDDPEPRPALPASVKPRRTRKTKEPAPAPEPKKTKARRPRKMAVAI